MDYKQCACCGQKTLGAESRHDICPVCGWEDDPIQNEEPGYAGGANLLSLIEAKNVFAERRNIISYEDELKLKKRKQKKEVMTASVEALLAREAVSSGPQPAMT